MNLDDLVRALVQGARMHPEVQQGNLRVVVVVATPAPDGAWRALSVNADRNELVGLMMRASTAWAMEGQLANYHCASCNREGHVHGSPPLPGWVWTPAGKLVCLVCREQLTAHTHTPEDVDGMSTEELQREALEDEPDLAQAPTNRGHVPVPLFVDDDDDPEDEIELSDALMRQLESTAVQRGALTDEQMRKVVQARLATDEEQLAELTKAVQALAYVAPELWLPADARAMRRYCELKGEELGPCKELVDRLDPPAAQPQRWRDVRDLGGKVSADQLNEIDARAKADAAALEAEARRLVDQERNGG